jgi:hypothetical protein
VGLFLGNEGAIPFTYKSSTTADEALHFTLLGTLRVDRSWYYRTRTALLAGFGVRTTPDPNDDGTIAVKLTVTHPLAT